MAAVLGFTDASCAHVYVRFDDGTEANFVAPDRISVGSKVRVYSSFDAPRARIRGVDVDGVEVFYRTKAEDVAAEREEAAAATRRARLAFERMEPAIRVRLAALPDVLRERIERMEKANPNFWRFLLAEVEASEKAEEVERWTRGTSAAPRGSFRRLYADVLADLRARPNECEALRYTQEYAHRTVLALASALLLDTPVGDVHGVFATMVGCREYGCHRKEATI